MIMKKKIAKQIFNVAIYCNIKYICVIILQYDVRDYQANKHT